jgi:Pyruvate/2-oxoacid:ferredoxin oxidoreductase delta subunit
MKQNSRHSLVKSSTLEFFRTGRNTPGYNLYDWLHGYVYGRWPYLYIGLGTGEHRLAKTFNRLRNTVSRLTPGQEGGSPLPEPVQLSQDVTIQPSGTFADSYHGKVVPLNSAVQLVTIHEEIQITNLEKVIPYPKARDIILKNPEHILALECPCRSARENPCLPLDVCLIVGDPFASFVEEHHPRRSRRITQDEAVEILRAEDERGHVHHAFFKDAMLGRFYAICNCCACCCGAMQAHQHGTPMLASSGYVCQVDRNLCLACGECNEYCQFGALRLGETASVVDQEKCMGCGVCVEKCEQGALALEREVRKGEPLEIEKLFQMA